jgi:stage V sporulation protein G
MEITDIRIRHLGENGRMKAIVSVTFDNCFTVHDIKIIEGQEKLFIAMPSRKTPENDFKDIAHPIHQEYRDYLNNALIEKYHLFKLEKESNGFRE